MENPRSSVLKATIERYRKTEQEKEESDKRVFSTNLAHHIQESRLSRGLSQRQLAERMDVSRCQACKMENPDYGKHSVRTLFRIAKALGMELQIRFVDSSEK